MTITCQSVGVFQATVSAGASAVMPPGIADTNRSDNVAMKAITVNCGTGVPSGSGNSDGLTVAKDGAGTITLSWNPSCVLEDLDYEIYQGTIGDWTSHVPDSCSTGSSTTANASPSALSNYYLIVPYHAGSEGSYGTIGSGGQRPPSSTPCLGQVLRICPP